jgi:3-hydroxyacyl-CoA dehydrogenase/enoyl-CoA hydratase/3-hydroxybutyryl-CoA epimerase
MGGGIAQLFADKGVPVRMKDLNANALALGVQAARKLWAKQVERRRIRQREALQKLNLIAPVLDYSGFEGVDLVVEAILEKMDVKRKVFQELEAEVRASCVIASNTSSLSVSEMQKGMKHPERFVGMHFFNPVNRMPLVEVIQGRESSPEAVNTVFQFCKQVGKTPIIVKDVPGFLVNRLLMPYLNEATFLVAEGVPVLELDRTILKFGMPMGPLELIDEVGVDVGAKVAHILHEAYGARMEPCPLNSKVVESGRLGKKGGKGFYLYDPTGRSKRFDPEIYSILGVSPQSGVVSEGEQVDRCILPMINEASRALEEQVVSSAAEVDLGMIMGTGFPPFRGGLLRFADTLGAREIVSRLETYARRFGPRYEPSPSLIRRAQNGQSFY